jgi:hypothetical protein
MQSFEQNVSVVVVVKIAGVVDDSSSKHPIIFSCKGFWAMLIFVVFTRIHSAVT